MLKKEIQKFDPTKVPLQGSNIIEASAGTGKTYSITILVMRLLLEKNISINQILIVTFTKAAVAELEERIRKTIKSAFYYCKNNSYAIDENIKNLIENNREKGEVEKKLKEAVLFLDETHIMTIDSFCQKSINQNPIATNQIFGIEIQPDLSPYIKDLVNEFWRKYITTLEINILSKLINRKFDRDKIKNIISNYENGQILQKYNPEILYNFDIKLFEKINTEVENYETECQNITDEIENYYQLHKEELKSEIEKNRYAKKAFQDIVDDKKAFMNLVEEKYKSANYIEQTMPYIFQKLLEKDEFKSKANTKYKELENEILFYAIQECSKSLKKIKNKNNFLTYSDVIQNLHNSLHRENSEAIRNVLTQKYKAAFIDEFQDTDKLQYEIFNSIFQNEYPIFYIGDPKQSIYAWRKADLDTYFKAKSNVDNVYEMNVNFRSSASFINSMNDFFLPNPDFDTFHFGSEDNNIKYIPISSPTENKKGDLYQNNKLITKSIEIISLKNKGEIEKNTAKLVLDLLENENNFIKTAQETRRIKPSDIGILIRNKKEGIKIKKALTAYNIPSIVIDDNKILKSNDALNIYYILYAIHHSGLPNIYKALLCSYTKFTKEDILQLDSNTCISIFRDLNTVWKTKGIYACITHFVAQFQIKEKLIYEDRNDRAYTNIIQITEKLHKIQTRKNLNPLEMLDWLKKSYEGMTDTNDDESELRIENDDESVSIVTIHKSKGLEYKIVIAPFLDLNTKTGNWDYINFRDEQGNYVTESKDEISEKSEKLYSTQTEQENRRLIYVAITRAVYKCFVFRNKYYKNSSLTFFTNSIAEESPSIETTEILYLADKTRYTGTILNKPKPSTEDIDFQLLEQNWMRMSYSSLAFKSQTRQQLSEQKELSPYDDFIFSKLKKGSKTGNFLHSIFEKIDFHNAATWQKEIKNAIQLYDPTQQEYLSENINILLNHVLKTTLKIENEEFTLADIAPRNYISEMEFDFPIQKFNTYQLYELLREQYQINIKNIEGIEGMMTGKIDLIFKTNEKYYILDWKSNYLGNSLLDYSPHQLAIAMDENNYHLQYLIYSVALKKHMALKEPTIDFGSQFGGVFYLFLRGARAEKYYGVFYNKPSIDLLNEVEKMIS